MPARKPNLANAGVDLAFAVASFACGASGFPAWTLGAVILAMIVTWGWSRRGVFSRMNATQVAVQVAVGVTILVLVLAGAYWLGLAIRGAFT